MLRTFFGRLPTEREAPKVARPSRGPSYDPRLITALTHQHRQLVLLLVKASSTAEQCYFAETAETLRQFKEDLDAHLERESSQLVPYLSHHLWGEGVEELIREMRSNSALIDRTVRGFLDHYLRHPVDADNLSDFVMQIERVCEDFSQEVQREEASFYTLYMAPEAY
ncbi:MAG TPA: hemerythrin domain-containing protein [Gammaproteobacteria bacterium]